MSRYGRTLALVTALSVGTSGCLLRDTQHTWYLEPGGGVTWSVLDAHVRSDAEAAADRQNEETGYITAVTSRSYPIARGLSLVGAREVHTTVLRAAVPFTVLTEARFTDIAELGRAVVGRTGLIGSSVLEKGAGTTTWTLTIRDPKTASADDDQDMQALMEAFNHVSILLTEGRFTAAEHFTLSSDRRLATLASSDDLGKAMEDGAPVVFKLTWGK